MPRDHLKIAFVRRGYSRSGGAEAYLKRLARGLHSLGHEPQLITTEDWPEDSDFSVIVRVVAGGPEQFADAVESRRDSLGCDVLMSLERVWKCDVLRAGDGVHRLWLERRKSFIERLRVMFNPKHRMLLRLEESLYKARGAGRVIANSGMVKQEIAATYGYPDERIDVIYNGVPLEQFWSTTEQRAQSRAELGLGKDEVALLFVGTGWERKGLRAAIDAAEKLKLRLFVAGRGNAARFRSQSAQFLGEIGAVASLYRAADMFVLPTAYDPFSNACLEALASGLPVITTRNNGFSEVIEDSVHGSIVDGTPDAVAHAIRYWSDRERRQSARPAILERAAQFDITRNVERTLAVLVNAAGR